MNAWRIALSAVVALVAGCAGPVHRDAATGPTASTVVRSGDVLRDCEDCPETVVIPAGDFVMGSPGSEPGHLDDESPQRSVHVGRFAMGRFDVTRGQWAAFVSATNRATVGGCAWSMLPGSDDKPDASASWRHLGFEQVDAEPVVCVTYGDAQDYARWLSERTGHRYRLPTESEWEYAARAGTTTPYPWGATAGHEFANYGADTCCGTGVAAGRDRWLYTSPVGSFPANAFGLYDMHGNVLQWVQDCYAGSYVASPSDGSADQVARTLSLSGELMSLNGANACSYRGVRGGDWGDPPEMIRSAARNFAPPPGSHLDTYKSSGLGFRLARSFD